MKLVLPGGTDVAEMALFSLEAVAGVRRIDETAIESLEKQGFAVRMPTGADGGYLLHAYVDEPIPEDVLKHCANDDRIAQPGDSYGLRGASGHLPGDRIPDGVSRRPDPPCGGGEGRARRHEDAPDPSAGHHDRGSVYACGAHSESVAGGGLIVGIAIIGLKVLYYGNPALKRLEAAKGAVELEYPSIVVAMRSV